MQLSGRGFDLPSMWIVTRTTNRISASILHEMLNRRNFSKLSGPAACHAVLSPQRLENSSGLFLRPRAVDDYGDDSVDSARLAC